MAVEVDTRLEEVIREQVTTAREGVKASRVTNALLLARAMNLDITKPRDAQRVLRHLRVITGQVESDVHD